VLTVYLALGMLLVVACAGAPRARLARLGTVRIRHAWLLWAALADQIVVISVLPAANVTALAIAHVASYLAAGACLLANRRLPGGRLIGLGGALNGLVICVNGGTLPASESAVRAAGQVAETGAFTNSEVLADPRLPWLGDVFATPVWLPGHNVFGLGDLAIWVGLAVFLWRTCRLGRRADRGLGAGAKPLPRHASRAPAGYDARHAARRAAAAAA
jgi:hypothetical protein